MSARRLRRLALPALALMLLVSGTLLILDATGRRADRQAGHAAADAARESIVAILSYQPETAEKTLGVAARDRLTGSFLDTYTQLVRTVVVPDAIGRRITATAKVPAVAVVSAEADKVVLLAYVDQVLVVGKEPPDQNNSSVRVTMENVGGHWLISGFDPI